MSLVSSWFCLALSVMDSKHRFFEEWVDTSSSFSSDSSWTSFDLSTDLTSISSDISATAPDRPLEDRLPSKCRPLETKRRTLKAEWRETSFLNDHKNKTSGWPPPGQGSWGGLQGPPYSWDSMSNTRDGRDFLTNQGSQSSSLEEVHLDGLPPAPRLVEMRRDPVLGFGFVAGSEKPVVVRSVTPGGPSEGKLLPGDEIIMINDEPVSSAPRERVIDLVRSCKESIMLTVVQPYPSPKSAFISAAKKAMLKSNPVKVRFAEEVIINGQVPNPVKDNSLLFMPNVLKVYLENGQTKSFRFDSSTSIKEVILTLQEKLSIRCIEHFSLVLEERTEGSGSKLLLLHEQEMLTQVTQRPGSNRMKCFFRISFMPRDPVELLRRDAVAFEYLYVQCCNDVVLERFGPELKYDAALRLAALQMYILSMTARQSQKVSLKYIQKEWGLPLFLPPTVLSSMKEKNIKKALTHILKTNQNLVPLGKKLTALQAKVHYLRYISELKLYGGREFKSILLQGEKQTEVMLLVGPRYGISHVINARTNLVALLADFSHVNRIEILTEDEMNVRLELHVLDVRPITLIMESSDAMNLACLTAGYYRLLVDSRRSIFNMANCNNIAEDDTGQDRVLEWPYSTSFGENEEPAQGSVYNRNYSDNGQRENSISPYFNEPQNLDSDLGKRRSPVPPPLPPATRHKTQDSPRSAKVSFIFGGNPPLNRARNYEALPESPESSELFQFSELTHIYSNIITEEGGEEPVLRELFNRDATDDAEDDEDASCEEDSTGGTPVGDNREGGLNCDSQGARLPTAAGKATFLNLSGSTDDIIDLTSLPPPEGDDGVNDDEDDSLLQTLNLAIAAPPPGFRDSIDEDTAPEGRPLSTCSNDDIPVSLIDAVPTHGEEEGSRGGQSRLENAVVNSLQALADLSVSERRPHRPPPRSNNTGMCTSQGFSPESSSDSGNETNSSEMTEISELAATHRLNESHMRLLVATTEGYQPLLEEKTEFPVSPNSCANVEKKPRSPTRHLQPPAVPPRRSPQLDLTSSGLDRLEVKSQNTLSVTLQHPSSTTPGGKHQKKSAHSSGKYNTFSTREGFRSEINSRRSYLDLNQRTSFIEQEEGQRGQNSFFTSSSVTEGTVATSPARDPRNNLRPSSAVSDRFLEVVNMGGCDAGNGATTAEQDEHLVVASLLSPSKQSRSGGSEQGSDTQSDHQPISRQQSVARLCEYHLAKRISNLQGEAHSSLQGSLCSSLDAGGSTNSSACATPNDSPLGPGAIESKHNRLQKHHLSSSSSSLLRVLNNEDSNSGVPVGFQSQNTQSKDPHPHADPNLLRKMLPNIHPPFAGGETSRPSSATPSKHKEITGNKKHPNDIHVKQQPSFKGLNPKEGSEAYRQLINYLTVSQMHQGGKLHSAGMGGAVKKDSRRFITSNPQLIEMVKGRGSTTARCPCMPSSLSSPFLSPNTATSHSATMQLANKDARSYLSATLPAKLKRSPDMHVQRLNDSLDFRRAPTERRSSFSGLESELGREGIDPEHFLFQCKKQEHMNRNNRPPPRSRSQPSGTTEDWFKPDSRSKHAGFYSPQKPNDSFSCSTAPSLSGQRAELNALSLGRGDYPSAFIRQTSSRTRTTISSPTPQSPPPPPPPLPPPLPSSLPVQVNSSASNSGCPQDSLHSIQLRQNQNHIQSVAPTLSQTEPLSSSMQRGRDLKRSSSNVTASSGSVEALFDKPIRSRSQQPLSAPMSQQSESKVQRRQARKRLSKSYSQGSVSSHATCWSTGSGVDSRRSSVAFPLQKDSKHTKGSQKLDTSPWRCNGPFSYCFFKRKTEGEDDEIEWDRPRRSRVGGNFDNNGAVASAITPYGSSMDEQLYGEVLDNMSFSDRLARINSLKDRMYSFPCGFNDVRRDANELIALVRSSVGRCDRGIQMPIQDVSQYKQLLSVESKELGRACRKMAQAHSSPDEMLLAVTCSFQVLCCLCEACMCLVRGLGASASQQQREVVAKVDEVVMNYICLLKAAEAATVGAPGEHSVDALVRHSSTMSAIANALTRSLKTLLSK
ncbi:FERM and PDZ domain-containing protein 4-like isoform X1 [Cyprinodon tularosa]|uniref:FERM and PDZ domain-containing protein 4-like isoform X1 n=1 Tax=Cyprinodon tularosa TaxID=77115 RepID=UPI0018E26259|nr:FERM and PDZ domain-containing protein 4-like isoform X1 [Cyprinodon tularosa]